MTTRDELVKGPKFEPLARATGADPPDMPCEACGERCWPDRATWLCRPCWRVWRFAARIHAFGPPMAVGRPLVDLAAQGRVTGSLSNQQAQAPKCIHGVDCPICVEWKP